MKKRLPFILLGLIAIGAGLFLYTRAEKNEQLSFTGFIEGEEKVIKSEISGRVETVAFTDGSRVQQGDLLAEIDAREYRSQVMQQELSLKLRQAKIRQLETQLALARDTYPIQIRTARANIAKASSDVTFAEKELTRRKDLLDTKYLSQQSYDRAENQLETAQAVLTRERAALAHAEANLRQIELAETTLEVQKRELAVDTEKLEQMRIILDKYTIRAPCTCTVQTRLIRAGEYVNPGTGIATLLDPLDKYVRIYVPVPDLGKVHIGDPVSVEPDALPGVLIPGEISFIEDIAQFTPKNIEIKSDRMTQVFATKVRILDQLERLKPGMEGTAYLNGARQTEQRAEPAERLQEAQAAP